MDGLGHPILQQRTAAMAGGYVFFGPQANCTLAACSPKFSVYGYIPSFATNLAFVILFSLAIVLHLGIGAWSRSFFFMGCMVLGCVDEILGYAGRMWMSHDLWDFRAFMIQVVCITTAPVFFCAAIYVMLAQTITAFGPQFSRFNPRLFYWVFILCDLVSLALQAAGGTLSAVSSGADGAGVRLALSGLALQVATLVVFCALYADYLWRLLGSPAFRARAARPGPPSGTVPLPFAARVAVFYAFEALAVVLILARCAFRVRELSRGYTPGNRMLRREGLFIGLEGVPIVIAAYALLIGHPGLVFDGIDHRSPFSSSSPKSPTEGAGSSPEEGQKVEEQNEDGQREEGQREEGQREEGQKKEAPPTSVTQVTAQA